MNEALQKEKRNETPQEKECKCCADAALPLSSLHTARPRRWAGRYTNLPRELREVFEPIIEMHLERLQHGEILEHGTYVPQVGLLTLRCRNGELFAFFIDSVEYAKQKLQLLRLWAAAIRRGTIVRNSEGKLQWAIQPPQSILPLPLKVFPPTNLLREQQLEFWRSPPWEQDREKAFKTALLEVCPRLVPSLWVSPSTPSPSAPPALPPSR